MSKNVAEAWSKFPPYLYAWQVSLYSPPTLPPFSLTLLYLHCHTCWLLPQWQMTPSEGHWPRAMLICSSFLSELLDLFLSLGKKNSCQNESRGHCPGCVSSCVCTHEWHASMGRCVTSNQLISSSFFKYTREIKVSPSRLSPDNPSPCLPLFLPGSLHSWRWRQNFKGEPTCWQESSGELVRFGRRMCGNCRLSEPTIASHRWWAKKETCRQHSSLEQIQDDKGPLTGSVSGPLNAVCLQK